MKKIISVIYIIVIIAVLSFVLPNQTYAAWWNPLSWFTKNQQVEEQKQPQAADQNIEATEKQNTVAPIITSKSSDTKTVEDLKADIVALKTNLDNLYAAHNRLVNDHNTLLKYTTDLEKRQSSVQSQPTNNVPQDVLNRIAELERKAKLVSEELYGNGLDGGLNPRVSKLESAGGGSLDTKVNSLERIINDICRSAFGSPTCPIGLIGGDLESRIEKLERGY